MIIAGNWKMNGTFRTSKDLLAGVTQFMASSLAVDQGVTVLVCPPATMLSPMANKMRGRGLVFGGQDCHSYANGAFTGDVSAEMLADAGASYVIVGHSERRQHHGETSKLVQEKAVAAKRAGLIPIICVGETLGEREAGKTKDLLALQIKDSLPASFGVEDFIVAYEPIWAIGTGMVASIEMIQRTHEVIISLLPAGAKVLYGGSVNAENAEEILLLSQVQGVLVGGASLKAESFNAIINAAIEVNKKR